jgi:hypothetical protein
MNDNICHDLNPETRGTAPLQFFEADEAELPPDSKATPRPADRPRALTPDLAEPEPPVGMPQWDISKLLTEHFSAAVATWQRIAVDLRRTFDQLADERVLLSEKPATRFILTWMREARRFERIFGSLFRRKKRPPIADDFTAAVAMCLSQFLATHGFLEAVRSEETTHRKRGATRPDISILANANTLIATVECKTDFGFSRGKWKAKCEHRSQDLQDLIPGASCYLCVLTEQNWPSSELIGSEKFGKEWFCLSRKAPGKLSDPISESDIRGPIEPMFLDILTKLTKLSQG